MADKENVLFGAEFEGTQLATGTAEVVNQLEKMKKSQEELAADIAFTNEQIKEQEKETAELEKKYKAIIPVSKAAQKEQFELAKQIKSAKESTAQLKDDLPKLQKQYKDTTVQIKDMTKSIQAQEKAALKAKNTQSELSKTVSKFTDINKLTASGVKSLGNALTGFIGGALTGFAGGLLAGAIPAVLAYVDSLFDATEEVKKFEKQQKLLSEIDDEAAKSSASQVARLEVYRQKLTDLNLPQTERIRIAKEYNKIADEGNKIDLKQIDNLDIINAQIAKQTQLIIKRAIAKAAENKLAAAAEGLVDSQLQAARDRQRLGVGDAEEATSLLAGLSAEANNLRDKNGKPIDLNSLEGRDVLKAYDERLKRSLNIDRKSIGIFKDNIKEAERQQKEFNELAAFLNPLLTIEDTKDKKVAQGPKAPENVFLRELARIREAIAKFMAKDFQSEDLIVESFKKQLERDFTTINNFLKNGNLTKGQAEVLKAQAEILINAQLEAGLKEFNEKLQQVLRVIDGQIDAARTDLAQKRVANIRDDFEREAAEIESAYVVTAAAYNKSQEEFRRNVDEQVKKGLLDPATAVTKKYLNSLVWGDLLDEAAVLKNNRQAALAAKKFQQILSESGNAAKLLGLDNSEETTEAIREQTALYLQGELSYEKYQKRVTEILQKETRKRRQIELDDLNKSLDLINERLKVATDPEEVKKLTDQRVAILGQIDGLEREILKGSAEDKRKKGQFEDYLKALFEVASQVVSFWNQVNEAEARALDRSIAIQNKRVANAQEIAEKGNAEYLEMEQKRLDELERKREANARKQLAINNALTASQALVAAISAIAQATQSGSPLAAIAAVAAVVGAIGAAYSFVNSLQPQEAAFNEGTPYVDEPGAKPGKDTIRARLTKGERVVTKDDNQKYWDTLQAIHNNAIPPEALNNFVNMYPNMNVPMVDYDRLQQATAGRMGADSPELLNRVDRLQGSMEAMVEGLNSLGLNVKLDENGLEASFTKIQKRKKLRSRA